MKSRLLLSLALVASCAQNPPIPAPSAARDVPSRSTDTPIQAFGKQQLEMQARVGKQVEWAKDAIRTRQRRPLTGAEAQQAVRNRMRDPQAVRFRGIHTDRATGAVCGWYNAKNGFGAYVGEEKFVYYHLADYDTPQVSLVDYVRLRHAALEILEIFDGMCPALARE